MTVDNPAPPSPKPRWTTTRIIQLVAGLAVAVVSGLVLVGKFATWNDLPGCDSTRAKDTLSDIFKKNNVNASRYEEIKTLIKKDDEITCYAKLTLRDGGTQEIDYSLLRDGSDITLQITRSNP